MGINNSAQEMYLTCFIYAVIRKTCISKITKQLEAFCKKLQQQCTLFTLK